MEILGFRFRSGEDVIGKVENYNEETGEVTLYRPVVPMNVPSIDPNTGQPIQGGEVMRMLKWAPFAEQETFTFEKGDYIGQPYKVWKQLEDYYLEATSSIQIASAGQMNS